MGEPEEAVRAELLVHSIGELATPEGSVPRGGADFGRIACIEDAAIAVGGGVILGVGPTEELRRRFSAPRMVDASGCTVVPGFVDAHTHPVFATTREAEFDLRTQGASYVEIAEAGGGILSSVRGVREASEEALTATVLRHLDRFLELGTTTVECKTGYGLSTEAELKSLRALDAASRRHPVHTVSTFLGAHAYPAEFGDDPRGYEDLLVDEMIPAVAESGLARYADAFTEGVAFSVEATRRILGRAKELGLGLRLHVDQLSDLDGAALAAELGAATADHLEYTNDAGIEAMLRAGVQPVLCALVPLFLRIDERETPARRMIEAGLAPVVATDFNPGSCFSQSMPGSMAWSALRLRLSAAEALCGATLNAACSLGLGHDRGSLEVGKRADFLVLDVPNHRHLVYEQGRNPVRRVFVGGEMLVDRETPRPRVG